MRLVDCVDTREQHVCHIPVCLTRTVDLERSFGITFFARYHYIVAIHEHTKSHPTAVDTFRRIPAPQRLGLVWNYVTLSDRVLELGHVGSRRTSPWIWVNRRASKLIILYKWHSD